MRARALALAAALALLPGSAPGAEAWNGYLDYAYVYSSAEPEALRARLAQYGQEAGISLDDYVVRHLELPAPGEPDEARTRRRAIAHLLQYLASGEPAQLERSAEALGGLEDHLGRHENRYWTHYILAQRALERGQRHDFVAEILALWLGVVVPLEAPYETLQALSLSDSPHSGFAAALPYVYENVARLILIRSQRMGLARGLDPLGALVRLLNDGRVGAHPDVVPAAASSRDYLERIVERLDGPESDAGSLTFTLALFEASKYHERARGLLASRGLDAETLEAMRVASGAYETALQRADTVQGQCAVYTRVLRQLGELSAAAQRLGAEPDFETPFSVEGAIEVYAALQRAGRRERGWQEVGYRKTGRQSHLDAMHQLWEEIQEASLNLADTYLARSVEKPHRAAEHSRSAARLYSRYLSFFHDFATPANAEAVPDSAYFAAFEAARGFGDAFLGYAPGSATPAEIERAARAYRRALVLFPFDRELWSALTAALARQGREREYLARVRPVAEAVAKSRHVDTWIASGEPEAERIAALRRALADDQVLLYLGFAEASGVGELERRLEELRARRREAEEDLRRLAREREALDADSHALAREIADATALLERLERQLKARERALPLYRDALGADGLAPALRARRDHPLHTLLRRMYHEGRG